MLNASNHILESTRVRVQKRLDSQKSHAERNRLGQFATPPELALDILRFAKDCLPTDFNIHFLDPAFGTGAFYSALINVFPSNQIKVATGIEIDPHYGHHALDLWTQSFLQLQIADFFSLKPPIEDADKANLIVCNPPYVRHHHITSSEKEKLQRLVASTTRIRLSGLTGLYCYFLLYAHCWLKKDGYACWLIPNEFMDVNYGAEIKQYLLNHVTLLHVHRFDEHQVQFSDALVSSTILWFKKSPPSSSHIVKFTFGSSLTNPEITKIIPAAELNKAPKWSRLILKPNVRSNNSTYTKLSDLFDIKRGIATGANDFFILSSEEAKKFDLPAKYLLPILPSPRYLKQNIIEADELGNPVIEEKSFLLSCDLPESQVKQLYPSLWDYYQLGIERKVNKTYICNHRSPWYSQESRPPCPFLCTYMGRYTLAKMNPFRFILNYSKGRATNVYLLLYPKPALDKLIRETPDAMKRIWQTLEEISVESLVGEGRVYGGGLYKLEPRELSNASVENLLASLPELSVNYPLQEYNLFFDHKTCNGS